MISKIRRTKRDLWSRLYLTKFDCVIMDDETYVEANYKQLSGQEVLYRKRKRKGTRYFQAYETVEVCKEISGLASHLYLWLEKQHFHSNQDCQLRNLREKVFENTSAAWRSTVVPYCVGRIWHLAITVKDHGKVCKNPSLSSNHKHYNIALIWPKANIVCITHASLHLFNNCQAMINLFGIMNVV